MKETTSSCTLVDALMTTAVFATTFTVPGRHTVVLVTSIFESLLPESKKYKQNTTERLKFLKDSY